MSTLGPIQLVLSLTTSFAYLHAFYYMVTRIGESSISVRTPPVVLPAC